MANAKTKTKTPDFPFLGQGDAGYYEWFEMFVWFASPVPKAKRKALLAGAPRLCVLDAQWPDPSLLWASTGDQWIQQHLVEEYGTPAAKKKMAKAMKKKTNDEEMDDDDLDDTIAMGDEQSKFNADIEKWVIALNAKQPILFVARREDGEAGGTKLGKWHEASIPMFTERALPVLTKLKGVKADDLRRAPIAIAIAYVGEKNVPPAVRKLGERD
ncbi:MAG TPA: hypothetical protein VGH87_31015 [Polyangiaceae bacterium]|nr:hypothetical protein [Polyangiaceae bacterium]